MKFPLRDKTQNFLHYIALNRSKICSESLNERHILSGCSHKYANELTVRMRNVYAMQGKGKMNTYWLVGEKDDPQTAVQLKQLLREVRKDGKQLRHAL